MRRAVSDVLISGGVLVLLLMALLSFDPRVRSHVGAFVGGSTPASAAVGATTHLADVGSAMYVAAKNLSIEHAPMMVFVGAASILFLFMVRT